jgi:hypothetical protein
LLQELESFFDSDKNLCLSLSQLIARSIGGISNNTKNVRLTGGNKDLKMQLAITEEFKVYASEILLERVTPSFLLLTNDEETSHMQPQNEKITSQTLAETEYFVKNIVSALAQASN